MEKYFKIIHDDKLAEYNQLFQDLGLLMEETKEISLAEVILIIGGDGTLNYFINNFQVKSNIPILYIPSGTANDFAKSLRIEQNGSTLCANEIFSLIENGLTTEVPIMKCNDKYFINVASFGSPANVTNSNSDLLKRTIGKFSYYVSALNELFSEEKFDLEIVDENLKLESLKGFLISQGEYVGGGLRATTSFRGNFKSKFNFLTTTASSIFEKIENLIEVTTNELKDESLIISKFYSEIKIKVNKKIPVKLDGEDYSENEFHIKKTDKKIKFFLY